MNFMGTKKFYIIKTCEQILYFNSLKHHIRFQYNCRGWGLGVGHYPSKISSDSPRSMLLALPNFDQTMWFSLSYFRPDPKFYPQFQTLQVLHSSSKHDESSYPRKYFWVVCYSKCTSSRGDLLKHTVYIQYHSTFSLFQIRTYSYIAYDKPFKKFR